MRPIRKTSTIAALAVAFALPAFATPRAVPVEPIKDFDIVVKGEVIEHAFQIRNEGDTTLEIKDVRPACGCTVAKFDKTVAPGKVGNVNIRMRTQDFAGPISKAISVLTNDDQNPKIQLVVKAKVQPFIAVVPGYARYNYVQGEPTGSVAQTLWAEDGAPLKVLEVKSARPYLEVSHRKAEEGERNARGGEDQWVVDITLKKEAPVGALREYVEVKLDHPKQKLVRIPISGFVRPRQHITPDSLELGALEGDHLPHKMTLHLTNFITDAIEVTKVETGVEGLSVEVEPNEKQPGHRFRVLLTVGPEVRKGELDSTIKFHITDKQNPVLELPMTGTIR